jgi:hypothetical protein
MVTGNVLYSVSSLLFIGSMKVLVPELDLSCAF